CSSRRPRSWPVSPSPPSGGDVEELTHHAVGGAPYRLVGVTLLFAAAAILAGLALPALRR
ncbi:hypothetical protein CTI14_70645, partial [Methylobacterium radiotolerans]